jgi:hypothetical protein
LLYHESTERIGSPTSGLVRGQRASALQRVDSGASPDGSRQEERIERRDVFLALFDGPEQDGGCLRSRSARLPRPLRIRQGPEHGQRGDEESGLT